MHRFDCIYIYRDREWERAEEAEEGGEKRREREKEGERGRER